MNINVEKKEFLSFEEPVIQKRRKIIKYNLANSFLSQKVFRRKFIVRIFMTTYLGTYAKKCPGAI